MKWQRKETKETSSKHPNRHTDSFTPNGEREREIGWTWTHMHMVPCNNAYTAMLRRIERNQRSVVPDAVCMWLRTDCQFMYTNVKCNCHGLCHGVVSPLMLLLLLLLMLVLLLMVVLYRLIRSVLGGKNCVGHIRDDGVLISRINYSSMRQIKIFPSIFSLGVRGAFFSSPFLFHATHSSHPLAPCKLIFSVILLY